MSEKVSGRRPNKGVMSAVQSSTTLLSGFAGTVIVGGIALAAAPFSPAIIGLGAAAGAVGGGAIGAWLDRKLKQDMP